MGILDRFKKITKETKEAAPKRLEKKKMEKKEAKRRKAQEEEAKKKQFMAVGAAAPERKEEGKKEEKSPDKKKPQKLDTKQAPRLLMKPVISEKATSLAADNKYVFAVSNAANKIEIKKAIQNLYGVTPFKINIMQIKGKNVRYGRTEGVTKNWKKAIITLLPGQKIDVYNP
ncbi:MAG: 50S ribosomal protein L23 [Patescibacteria group bacterium]